jgi:superfamily I DNA/RNA helicase
MVTTFTRRAATELNVRVAERCDQLLHFAKETGHPVTDPQVHNLRIGTIHSLCDGLFAEKAKKEARKPRPCTERRAGFAATWWGCSVSVT